MSHQKDVSLPANRLQQAQLNIETDLAAASRIIDLIKAVGVGGAAAAAALVLAGVNIPPLY